MSEKKAQFLPFHAINEFMRPDFRMQVVREVINGLENLPDEYVSPINNLTKKYVKIPGFRDSRKAPAAIRIRLTSDAFEKRPDLVSAVLAAWANIHDDLQSRVFNLLHNLEWQVFPLEMDRTKLPGFMTVWPKGNDFEVLNQKFSQENQDYQANSDDISLMVVWVSMRLPYTIEEDEVLENELNENPVELG
jgi:hypothetical protein